MSDATFTTFGVVEESTYGTTPASALRLMNVSDVQLAMEKNAQRPNVLTNDRRRYPTRPLQKSGSLVIPAPLQYENTLEMHEGMMCGSRASAVSVTGTGIAFTATTITDSGNGLGTFAVGDMVWVSGAAEATNNGWIGPLTAVAAGTLTFITGQTTAESAGATVTLRTRRLRDGVTKKSYSAEWAATDLTNEFRSIKGASVQSGSLTWAQNSWVEESYSLMGKFPAMANATIGTGAATAAKTSGFMNAVDDYGSLYFGSVTASSAIFTRLQLSISNALNPTYGLGVIGPSAMPIGPQDVTVSATLYYDDNARDFVDWAESHVTKYIWWNVVDPQLNKMAFVIPAVKIDVGNVTIGNAGTPRTVDVTISGHDPAKDPSSTFTSATWPYQAAFFYVPT